MPCCFTVVIPPGLISLLANGYFHDSNIANRDEVSTYLSQVIGNHPASTELSMAKHYFDPGPTQVRYKVYKVVIMQQGCHINA
jgi:hypothetical protein